MLTPEQIEQYYAQGYLVVENVITPEELSQLKDEIEAWIEESKQHTEAKPKNLNIDIHFLTDKRKSIMFEINYSIKYKQQLS